MSLKITVYCADENKYVQAQTFAESYKLAYSNKLPVNTPLYFSFCEEPPVLYDTDNETSLCIDFTRGGIAHRLQFGGGKGQTIAKAIGISAKNKPHILDATAGLGRDALILANLGCKVTMTEQSPVLVEMLKQAIHLAQDSPLFRQACQYGFKVHHANATEFMNDTIIPEADVVYLDPMYPEKKKSALVKKDMQILQNLIGHSTEEDNAEILKAAIHFARQRVVVKRPKTADPIQGYEPTMSLHSKKTRYDVYVIKTLNINNSP